MAAFRIPHRTAAGLTALLCLLAQGSALAGAPKYVAGVSNFNPAALGEPVHWANGQLNYYIDQGPLNSTVSNQQAKAMVDAAAALWSTVPTAGVTLTDMGTLNEDVSGANIQANGTNFAVTNEQTEQMGVITAPADIAPSATSYPVGVIFDADGSVTDALYGEGVSEQHSCQNNGVYVWIDSVNPNGSFAHGIILLNGLCATNANLLEMMSFELERAFGRLLGLDYAQVNPGAASNGETGGTQGWPVMQPLSGLCGSTGGACIPNPTVLRWDDIANLNRLYPITASNLASFPGKQITAANTISIQGTITFKNGVGMQGVNVVARPLNSSGNPLYQYTVSYVSGSLFNANRGDPVTGYDDANGNPLTMWGSNNPSVQGFFDLSGIPLPPGVTAANYQITFEAVNPLYILDSSVGPYLDGSPAPSGTLTPIVLQNLSAGSAETLAVDVADSSAGGSDDAIGSEADPRMLAPSGQWSGRLSQVGQTDWFSFPVRGGRSFTVVTIALDEGGAPSNVKALPALGVWDAFDPVGSAAQASEPGLDGLATGESWLQVEVSDDDVVRLGVADERGDGRPDYTYQGWVLYADTVYPQRLPATGGAIVICGMGFRPTDTVLVGGKQALITSISPNEITAIAPASAVSGSVDVEVDDLPIYYASAVISSGISYDSGTGDALTLTAAPAGTVAIGVPQPFSVIALGPALTPAGGVSVIYTVTSGSATLACGQKSCTVMTSGDGLATMYVTAVNSSWSTVTASLTNGSMLQTEFSGGTAPTISSLSPMLSVAAGATVTWTTQALVLSNGLPASGKTVIWQAATSGITIQSGAVTTNSSGIATMTLTVGALSEGQTATVNACLNGSSPCVTYTAFGARPEYASIVAVSGTAQSLSVQSTAAQITLRVLDMDGNPMAGASVVLYQALYAWALPCPPQGRCAQAPLLATQAATAASALDGSVTFIPASLPGVATNLRALAVTGDNGSINIAVEQHP
ncbi:MAG: IPT/TIG domain-containing protein [Terracidiphilus sp.]